MISLFQGSVTCHYILFPLVWCAPAWRLQSCCKSTSVGDTLMLHGHIDLWRWFHFKRYCFGDEAVNSGLIQDNSFSQVFALGCVSHITDDWLIHNNAFITLKKKTSTFFSILFCDVWAKGFSLVSDCNYVLQNASRSGKPMPGPRNVFF